MITVVATNAPIGIVTAPVYQTTDSDGIVLVQCPYGVDSICLFHNPTSATITVTVTPRVPSISDPTTFQLAPNARAWFGGFWGEQWRAYTTTHDANRYTKIVASAGLRVAHVMRAETF